MADAIVSTSSSLFTSEPPVQQLIAAQINTSDPSVAQLQTATNAIIPDAVTRNRLNHFPEDLYDLRPQSHLMRFLAALMGDSGAGQLRKRFMLTQIQSNLQGASFYDLDGFYGAIFGLIRSADETFPADPMVNNETPDQWDQITSSDASFRERIMALAEAIPMAGTMAGIKQAAQAIVQVECDVYETWRAIDGGTGNVGTTLTWDQMQSTYSTWQGLESKPWNSVAGTGAALGLTGVNTRAEIVVFPRKVYNYGDPISAAEAANDAASLLVVLELLKPVHTVLSIDSSGIAYQDPVAISYIESDSDYWEVIPIVTPNAGIVYPIGVDPYPLTPSQQLLAADPTTGFSWASPRPIGVPAYTNSQGVSWSHAPSVASTAAYSFTVDDPTDFTSAGSGGMVIDKTDFEFVTYSDGARDIFSADKGIADPQTVQGGNAAAGGAVIADPYSGVRQAAS